MEDLILTERQKLELDEQFEEMNRRFDVIEASIDNLSKNGFELEECALVHRFTPGLYIRQITMPAGSFITSKIHMTEHPFTISYGVVSVWCPHHGTQLLKAPHTGITLPGTRRILFCHSDVVWTTYHPTDKTDVKEIEDEILFHRVNKLLLEDAA